MEENYIKRAKSWLSPLYDEQTRNSVEELFKGDPKELEDSFYKNLEFGTGGLRGLIGVGTNRMNEYTVGMATQGFANYIKKSGEDNSELRVAIAYDNRNCSEKFAGIAAGVFAENGFQVYLFDALRPTPELSFAIRELKCNAGVMITASHNPKEYNGYKAYWSDGAQLIAPHDKGVIEEVERVSDPSLVRFGELNNPNIHIIGAEMDKRYLDSILSLTLSPDQVKRHNDMKIVYTPLHGTGVRLVPLALKQMGFTNITTIKEQEVNDGNFPTVKSPNPEEPSALEMAVNKAQEIGADIVMATDPDADRVGIAVRDGDNKITLLNGNQTASILTFYLLSRWKELGKLNKDTYMIKTIVTTELMKAIADSFEVQMYDVLTGFKYIAAIVKENEGKRTFIGGGEESYGFNVGEFVRDKDAVIACCMIAECAAWAAESNMTLWDLLQEIYQRYGLYKESLISVTKKGKDGIEQISQMMKHFRTNPPTDLAGSKVIRVIDYTKPEQTGLPKSDVLRFFSEDGSVVSVRPSGTEPKIKFYFGVKGEQADSKLETLMNQFSE